MPRRIPLPGVNIPRRPRVRGHCASHHAACGLWFDVESRGVDFCAVRLHGSPLFAEPVRALGLGVFDPAVCVSDSTPLAEVFHKLLAEHLPAVPIVNSQGWCWPAVVCLLCAAFNRVSCSRQGGGRFPSRRDESPRARPYTVQAGASRWRSAAGPGQRRACLRRGLAPLAWCAVCLSHSLRRPGCSILRGSSHVPC